VDNAMTNLGVTEAQVAAALRRWRGETTFDPDDSAGLGGGG
jgi:hypothetical protein